jgi:hypothetical protein
MSAQTSYNQKMSHGVAGGLYDLSNHTVDTRTNEEADGKVRFGLGVVAGTAAGKQVKLPTGDSAKKDFEGVVLNSHTHEQDYKGDVSLRVNETVGVITDGRVYVRIAADAEPVYGDALYLINSGDEAGYFTNEEGDNTVKVNGYFLGKKATDAIAPVYVKVDKE